MKRSTAAQEVDSGGNPLDISFGQHSQRAKQLAANRAGFLEIDPSAFTELQLSTVSKLARIAAEHPNALKYFPEGSKLVLTAESGSGEDWGGGWVHVSCCLKYPVENGSFKRSGSECFHRGGSNGTVERNFERFLQELESKELGSDGVGK